MAEPLGIIGVIGVVDQIIKTAFDLGLDWKDAPADAKQFVNELQVLKTILSETQMNVVLNNDFEDAFHGRHSTLLAQLGPPTGFTAASAMVSKCKQELDSLLDLLKKQAHSSQVGWERLKGAFLSKRRKGTVQDLQRQCETLNKLVSVDTLALASHTHKEVTDARKEQQIWQTNREGQAVLDWVTATDYSTLQSDLLQHRQVDTGQWLLNSTHYQQWVGGSQQTLFCPGIPRAGKTILTSIVVDNLHERFRDDRRVFVPRSEPLSSYIIMRT
jgi:hypothetical protein